MNAMPLPSRLMRPAVSSRLLQRVCTLRAEEPRLEGLDALVHSWQGRWLRWRERYSSLRSEAEQVLVACEQLSSLDETALNQRLQQSHLALRRDPAQARGGLLEALAVVGQLARRSLGLQPYAVQFMGALAIHRARLAEMATGEGKTLTVGLAGVLAGLSGRPCHIITANDYLAQRDAEEMTPLFQACGLRVTAVHAKLEPSQRPLHHDSDVVYLTAKELLADFLRDQIGAGSPRQLAQVAFEAWLGPAGSSAQPTGVAPSGCILVRGLHSAIVDEADSILIDEAVTPLILAAPRESRGLAEAVQCIGVLADQLVEDHDYWVMTQARSISLLPPALHKLTEMAADIPPVWRAAPRREELLRQALLVRRFFKPGQQYVVHEGEVVLLDEFTGRMTPGRALTAGLHQAIEAHEGLAMTDPNESLTQMSFQAFFSRFPRLSGCSGTAFEAANELWRVYGLTVVRIPTHRPRQTVHRPPKLLPDTEAKWDAIAAEVRAEHACGRPVLVGVRSVGASQALAERLADLSGVQVLNALTHDQEATIVAGAGQAGRITLATNMAGRGTDIRLGEGVVARGGLHVIVAEVNDSARVDRQLAGRCGRQGDPGSVSVYYSPVDDLALRSLPAPLRHSLSGPGALATSGLARLAQWAFRWAQKQAESHAFSRRWSVLKADEWMRSALPFASEGRRS
jgi:preprotein translocase subunit SecA